MAFNLIAIPKRIHKTLANLRTGIVLLILVVIASALGTFILQRPATDADKLARAYAPETLRWLDRIGLTDVFHSWWFMTLLTLVSLSIVFVSMVLSDRVHGPRFARTRGDGISDCRRRGAGLVGEGAAPFRHRASSLGPSLGARVLHPSLEEF